METQDASLFIITIFPFFLLVGPTSSRSGIQRHFHASHVIEILYMPGHKAAHGAILQGIMLRVPGKITGQDIKGGVSQLLCRDPLPVEWMAPGDHDGRPELQEGLLLKIVR